MPPAGRRLPGKHRPQNLAVVVQLQWAQGEGTEKFLGLPGGCWENWRREMMAFCHFLSRARTSEPRSCQEQFISKTVNRTHQSFVCIKEDTRRQEDSVLAYKGANQEWLLRHNCMLNQWHSMDIEKDRVGESGLFTSNKLSNYQRQAFIWETKYTSSNFKILSEVAPLQILVIHFSIQVMITQGEKRLMF